MLCERTSNDDDNVIRITVKMRTEEDKPAKGRRYIHKISVYDTASILLNVTEGKVHKEKCHEEKQIMSPSLNITKYNIILVWIIRNETTHYWKDRLDQTKQNLNYLD